MKTLKTIIELVVWTGFYSPIYFWFTYLDYLSKNVWGTRFEERAIQLTFVIPIVLITCVVAYFIIEWIIYKYELITRDYNKADTVKRGRGILDKVFNRKYRTYIDTGYTYWIDNATKWCDVNGNEIGRINWIDTEHNKQRMRAMVKNLITDNLAHKTIK